MTQTVQDPALLAQQPQATHARIEPAALEWMLICAAHCPQFLQEMRALVQPHHFTHEPPLKLLYIVLCASVDRYDGVTWETLASLASQELENDPTYGFTQQQMEILYRQDENGLFYQVVNPGVEFNSVNEALGRELLEKFVNERTVVDPLRRVMNPSNTPGVPSEIGAFLEVISKQRDRLSTLKAIPEVDIAPEFGTQIEQASVFLKTGVDFIDTPLEGQRPGDCNGLLGPTGGGKTTLGVQMAVAAAKQAWTEAQELDEAPALSVYFSYEESGLKIRPRIWSDFFDIDRAKLETMADWGELTTQENLAPYERAMQQNQDDILSEADRYRLHHQQLKDCLKLVDMSGSDDFPNAGNGFVPEIVAYLSRYEPRRIRSVFIDYAGLVCERWMQAQGMDESSYRNLLKTFGDRCRLEISSRFNCTTWVIHQLKGDAGNASPFKLMKHTDAAESRDFAVNMAACLCLGNADAATGCRLMNFSKVRYRPNEEAPPATLKIHSNFSRMEDVSTIYTADEMNRQFMSPSDRREVGGLENAVERVGGSPMAEQ